MLNPSDILDAKILIVDDLEANVRLLDRIAARGRLYSRRVYDGSARGLRAASQQPLRPDPARSRDARHGRIPGDGRPQGNRNGTATCRSS